MKNILIIQNCETESAGTILEFLAQNKINHSVVHTYKNQELPSIDKFSTVINLGCPNSIREYIKYDYLKKLYQYISQVIRNDIPYLGICFGAQILAHILGTPIEKNNVKEIGCYNITLTPDGLNDPIFDGFAPNFPVFHWHHDTFKIPRGATLLAEGIDCKNQAFRKGKAVGIQFHLEVTSLEVSKWASIYKDELVGFPISKNKIISDCETNAAEFKNLQFKLLENFL